MELTIYNTYVVMESQEQCDRMKKLCIDNDLPIWDNPFGWHYFIFKIALSYNFNENEFYCFSVKSPINSSKTKVTEQEFINLLIKKITTPKEKFLELVSKEKSNTIEKIRNRRQKKMDEYAIEFAEWLIECKINKKLLKTFKKEKGL